MLMNWLFWISTAVAEGETTTENTVDPLSFLSILLPMGAMLLIFYFLLIRPEKKKQKQVKEMLDNLKKGDRVTTIGGIYGTIDAIKDETITLILGQRNGQITEMTVARWAIRQVEEVSVENEGSLLN